MISVTITSKFPQIRDIRLLQYCKYFSFNLTLEISQYCYSDIAPNIGFPSGLILVMKAVLTVFLIPNFVIFLLKSLGIPTIWLALSSVIYSKITLFFALNHICSKSRHSCSNDTYDFRSNCRTRSSITINYHTWNEGR